MSKFKKIIIVIFSLTLTFLLVSCMGKRPSTNRPSSERESFTQSSSESLSNEDLNSESDSVQESSSKEESSESSTEGGEDNPPQILPTYEIISPINDENSSIRLIKTKYKTDSAVVADAIVTDFGADPTGVKDSASAIQSAINKVHANGGGTVFLPVGKYLVSSTITIHPYVTIVGDWNKPNLDNADGDFDYGTVILAKPSVIGLANPKDNPLFNLGGNAGIVGATFYYVDQNALNAKKYGYTVYSDCPVTATLKNLTFINSAYGIGVSLGEIQNELVNLENIYGTFLYNAISHNATTDVGFYDNITISTKFWKNASTEFKCAYPSALEAFVSNNLSAINLGDLDDQLISNVTIDGGNVGITFVRGIRSDAGFWGVIHNANINCKTGILAEYVNPVSGVVFVDSNVGLVENNSSVGCVKMSNSIYEVAGEGRTVQEQGNISKNVAISPLSLEFPLSQRLFIANNLTSGGAQDNSNKLQEILNSVGASGGIVVVPNGIYRLNASITIPKNVELRTTQSVFSRSSSAQSDNNGVIFISYVVGDTFVLKDGAGIVGARIWHARNDFLTARDSLTNGLQVDDSSVKGDGVGAYAYMNESVGAYVGFNFTACDDHILKSNYGLSYVNFIKAGGKDGVINQCLANPNFTVRSNLSGYFDGAIVNVDNWYKMFNSGELNSDFAILRDEIGRSITKMVKLENAENQVAKNVFCYGHAGLFDMINSTATLINTSIDYILGSNIVYELSGGTCDVVGSLRVHGTSVKVNSGTLTAHGRIAFGEVKEKAYDSSVSIVDDIEHVSSNAKRKTLFNCDSWNTEFNVSVNYSNKVAGIASWKWKETTLQGSFNSVDISEYKNGYLHFYIYCSDIAKIGSAGQIELTSSGQCDKNEYNWNIAQYVTKTGWNEVWLDFRAAGTTNGEPDLTKINYLRIYTIDSQATFYIDEIEVVTD